MPNMMLSAWVRAGHDDARRPDREMHVRWSDVSTVAVLVRRATSFEHCLRVLAPGWLVEFPGEREEDFAKFDTAEAAMAAADKRLRQMGYVLADDGDGVDRVLLETMTKLAAARPFDRSGYSTFSYWARAVREEAAALIESAREQADALVEAAKDGAK